MRKAGKVVVGGKFGNVHCMYGYARFEVLWESRRSFFF